MAVDVKMRYNASHGEVELVYGESVALTSGKDVMDSWGRHWAESNDYVRKADLESMGYVLKSEVKEEPTVSEKPVEEVNPAEPPRPGPTSDDESKQNEEVDSDS